MRKETELHPLDEDVLYRRTCEWVERTQCASISRMQLHFRIGYMKASRIHQRMIDNGVIRFPREHLN